MKPLFVIGTRPECIKLAPVIRECYKRKLACVTHLTLQHDVAELAEHFGLECSFGQHDPEKEGTITERFSTILRGVDEAVRFHEPTLVVGQGDTFSTLAAAQTAFFSRLPFVHIEAGLRSYNLQSPWPEEFNRRCVSLATSLHCCPTIRAAENLSASRMYEAYDTIIVTGNTVVDALNWTIGHPECDDSWNLQSKEHGGIVVVTAHRRENQGGGIARICQAVCILAEKFPHTLFFWPAHESPAVQNEMKAHPSWPPNVAITNGLRYPRMVSLLNQCRVVLTDSGGVQEECAALKKPCVILRKETERPEVVACGCGVLVGTDVDDIVSETERLLTDEGYYSSRQPKECPFGDGHAAEKIVDAMEGMFK